MNNTRELHRRRALKTASAHLDGSGVYVDCQIVNLHSRGARIRFSGAKPKTDKIELIIKPENVRATGQKVWESDNDIGVRFDQTLKYLQKSDAVGS